MRDFPKVVLYVQDVKAMSGGALWKGVFLADLSDPSAPRITLAREGMLVSQGPDRLDLHLTNGSTHEADPRNPDQYQISTFNVTDIPIQIPAAQSQQSEPASLSEMKVSELLQARAQPIPTRAAGPLIEFHRRLSHCPPPAWFWPWSGIPLGLSSKRVASRAALS